MDTYKFYISKSLEQDSSVVGAAAKLPGLCTFIEISGPIVDDEGSTSVYVVKDFESSTFRLLSHHKKRILAAIAFVQLANSDGDCFVQTLQHLRRPLFCQAFQNVTICFTGFRDREELSQLSRYVFYMGGRILRDMEITTTHLIAHHAGGEKFKYADTYGLPVMSASWIISAWDRRHDKNFVASSTDYVAKHKLKFGGLRVCFLGFTNEENEYMNKTLVANNGVTSHVDDPLCTHLVIDEVSCPPIPEKLPLTCNVVKAVWFWTSVQNETCAQVEEYLLKDNGLGNDRVMHTPGSAAARARKRKRHLAARQSAASGDGECKRRSSVNFLDNSGSLLDWTLTPDRDHHEGVETKKDGCKLYSGRQQKFLELVNTESNYVNILNVIVKTFKEPLEEMLEKGNPILDTMELKMIFGNMPPILETHSAMLEELRKGEATWTQNFSIGDIILNKKLDLLKAYPPFINYFEKSNEALQTCEAKNPRFHAFLKIRQSEPQCARQTLKELMIRPVQRLGSIDLLLNDLLKHTDKENRDYAPLTSASSAIKQILNHINEDKRKTEEKLKMLELFNDIENCPTELISSHRQLISKAECAELTDGRRGDSVVFHLFSDTVEICCKRRGKSFATLRGNKPRSLQKCAKVKQFKHLKLVPLTNIKMIVDVRGSDDYEGLFALEVHNSDTLQDSLVGFFLCDDSIDKAKFLETLCQQLARIHCTADPDDFIKEMEAAELGLDQNKTSNHSLSKAIKFANSAKAKMGRALSLSRTPSRIMHRRTAAEIHSPAFSQLAQMSLQSCTSLNELGTSSSSRRSSIASVSSLFPFL